jgi:putative redox protein
LFLFLLEIEDKNTELVGHRRGPALRMLDANTEGRSLMVEMHLTYDGQQRVTAVHVPTKKKIQTDAPVDNGGKGQSFSPSDLLASALGACMLTYIGKAGDRNGWNVEGTRIVLQKEMVADPMRRVGRIIVDIYLNQAFDDKDMRTLTNAVTTCPVKLSISDQIEVPITFYQP